MDKFQLALNQSARELLPICISVYLVLFVIFSGSHFLVLPADVAGALVGYSLFCILIGFAIRANPTHSLIEQHAERVLLTLLLLMMGNVVLHTHLTGDIEQTSNLIFLMGTAGYILPRGRYYYSAVLIALVVWLFFTITLSDWETSSSHPIFELIIGLMFSYFLHIVRRKQLSQVAGMQTALEELAFSKEQISASETLMQSLLDNLPAGIVVRDSETRVLYANEDARRQLGYEGKDMTGWSLTESARQLVGADGKELASDQYPYVRAHKTHESVINEVVGVQRPGVDTVWALVSAFSVDLGGDQGWVTTVAFVNITEQVIAELRLQESESRDSVILKSVQEAVVSVDDQNRITLFNPAAESLTGISVEAALGREFSDVVQYSNDEIASNPSAELNVKRGLVTSASGEAVAVEWLESEIFDSKEHLGRVYTFRDIREQQRLEHERAMLDKMSSVGDLAAGIAHDFNNLLTAIYGNVALAESSLATEDKARVFLKRSSESIHLATNLTKQLLTFSRGSEPVRRLINIEPIVRDASHFALSGSAVSADIRVAPNLLGVEADAVQLQQSIGNIVLNAQQAMQGSGSIEISIDCEFQDQGSPKIVITISDDGPGMEAELIPRIFDPYFTTRSDGTGLGLATSHSIITKHAGTLTASSEPGGGSTFIIKLPAVSLDDAPSVVQDLPSDNTDLFRVLVMDDDEVVLETICRLLEQFGHEVEGVADGEQAIERYRQWYDNEEQFDFVIMDLTIAGGMGGKAAADRILAFDPDAKLVVTSGYSEGAEMARYSELGFVARLEKPFRAAELKAIIAEVMQT